MGKKASKTVTAPAVAPEVAQETASVETPVEAPVANTPTVTTYVVGKTPKLGHGNMNDTKRSWDFMAAHLQEHGPQSRTVLQVLLKEQFNHQIGRASCRERV